MSLAFNRAVFRIFVSIFGGSLAAIAMAALLIGQTGCSQNGGSGGGPVRVPLSYTPEHANDSIRPYPAAIPESKIYVGQFEDQRDRKDAIGENVEHGTLPVFAASDPAEFVRQTLASQLRRAGLHVVDDQAQADRVITGRLLRFWVTESNNYEAEISAAIQVSDQSGAKKWEGSETGKGENFGRSLSPENYRQTLSDAMVRLTYDNLLNDSGFRDALK